MKQAIVVHGSGFNVMCDMSIEVFIDFMKDDAHIGFAPSSLRQPASPTHETNILFALDVRGKLCDASTKVLNAWIAIINQTKISDGQSADRKEVLAYAKTLELKGYEVSFFPKDEELSSILAIMSFPFKDGQDCSN
ncbi:MAG: hypothetical protein GC165_01195 [Armatimonadetes bacterium]|nr:hypothetical protein [Armatimonadota bacterium]